MIYHIYTSYTPNDPDTIRRNTIAQVTWKDQQWREAPVADSDLPRLWREKNRAFPFIKDVIDFGASAAQDDDILIYTNADIHVRRDCSAEIAARLQDVDACYCFRRDFQHRIEKRIPDGDFEKGLDYAGSDLKAFRAEWWRKNRDYMPDMVLGAEAWDPVFRTLIDETNPGGDVRVNNLICHERHGSYWESRENRYTLKMQTHCLGLAKAFFLQRGINPRQFGIP